MMRRLRQREQVVVALLVAAVIVEAIAVIGVRIQPMGLDHRAHGAIQNQDALLEQAMKKVVRS